ncbi:MAG: NAD(P)(+) transhydrogenase (Re/Si-specific) subunit alpha, partial [Nitrospirales bacterium]
MIVGVLKETYPGEHRVALVPAVLPSLKKGGMDVIVESKAGEQAGYPDSAYIEKGGSIASSRAQVFEKADCIVQVRLLGANLAEGQS